MKRIRCVLLLITLLLTGCALPEINIDDSAFRPQTTAMLDGVIANDFDACRDLVADQVDDESLRSALEQMNGMLAQVESYTLKPVSWNKNVRNGIDQTTLRYEMYTQAGDFYVDVALVEDVEGLASFYVTPLQRVTVTGTPGAMKGASLMQWLILLLGAAEIGFILWMAVNCFRHEGKGKVGWLLLILLVGAVVNLTVIAGRISFRFNVGIHLQLSALLRDSNGAMQLSLYVPVGAIVYWFRRKKLQAVPPAENPDPVPEVSEEVPEITRDSSDDS